jgi:hypothetical protein
MPEYKLRISGPRPFFAELPYYIWGRVNYDSEGDCKRPIDRNWTEIELTNRETRERLEVTSRDDQWSVSGPDPAAARLTLFLEDRCGAEVIAGEPDARAGDWDHAAAARRAAEVARQFEDERLAPFAVDHAFWGSWKWIGWFATSFTWVGRWIMDAVLRNDARAVEPCVHWLRAGTVSQSQSAALRYALGRLTGLTHASNADWIAWYDHGGSAQYPEPDFDRWYDDLKKLYGD